MLAKTRILPVAGIYKRDLAWIWESELAQSVALLVFVSALAYLPLSFFLGFYADDWFQNLEGQTNTVWLHVQTGRPGWSVLLFLAYRVLGDNVFYWHLSAYGLTLLTGISALWMLRVIWPGQHAFTTSVALLTLIFPGFSSHPVSMSYLHYYAAMTMTFISVGLSLRSLQKDHWKTGAFLTSVAIVCGLTSWLMIEQFVSVELVRYYLFWRRRTEKRSSARSLMWMLRKAMPYVVALGGYLIWRSMIPSVRPTTNPGTVLSYYRANFAIEIGAVIHRVARGALDSVVSWVVSPYQALSLDSSYRLSVCGALVLGCFGAVAFWRYTRSQSRRRLNEGTTVALREVLVVGALYVISIILIPAVTRFPIGLLSFGDRFFLGSALGSALLLFGFVTTCFRRRYLGVLLSVVVGLCIFTQLLIANAYRIQWQVFRNAWWQLSWRAPQIQSGTLVLVDHPSFYLPSEKNIWEEDIWGPLNAIYGSSKPQVDVAGQQFTTYIAKALDLPETYESPIDQSYYSFKVNVRQNVIVTMPNNRSCLHVINGEAVELPIGTGLTASHARYSQIDRILTDGGGHRPPFEIFGAEPKHGWCYYFQKADLARQRRDWQQVANLADESQALNLRPGDSIEWLPFLESHLRMKSVDKFTKLASNNQVPASAVCLLLDRMEADSGSVSELRGLRGTFSCRP